jgi:hypothetical protein
MTDITRRNLLTMIAATPVTAQLAKATPQAEQAHDHGQPTPARSGEEPSPYQPRFFTADEYATVTLLADLVLPADERSGSASDAGVPEFVDFMMIDQPVRQVGMRGGLAWLDAECRRRFERSFADCTEAERTAVLDDISWPARARHELSQGVAFFSAFRDLVATGFWTSRIGIEDLQYQGNTFVAEWKGCPDAALQRLGVAYEPGKP